MARTAVAARSPLLVPALLIAVGLVLLIGSFLFVDRFHAVHLAFLLLPIAGTVVLLRGDLSPSTDARAFAITRGSVESASVTINASDIDVVIEPLPANERLIAGQYAFNARPSLEVEGTHALLRLDRAHTSLLTLADWEVALATGLPWEIMCSASLGQIDADLSGLILETASFSSGFGSVRVVAPQEVLGDPILVRSVMGSVHLVTPPGGSVRVVLRPTRLFRVHVDPARYALLDDGSYQSLDVHPAAPPVTVLMKSTFGDAYLS